MQVASLDLCKQLFELSGWEGVATRWVIHDGQHYLMQLDNEAYSAIEEVAPAYDLGYLLRKLHEIGNLLFSPQSDGSWYVFWDNIDEKHSFHADNPEDAAAKLAIELFKQEILTKPNHD